MYEKYDKEAIRASVDFAALVSEDTELYPQGDDGELHGACPFCGEDIPHVGDDHPDRFFLAWNSKRGYLEWNCRKCPIPPGSNRKMAGGDIFDYVLRLYDDLPNFPAACQFLEDFAREHEPSETVPPVDREPAAEPETVDWLPSVAKQEVAAEYLTQTRGIPLDLACQANVGWQRRDGDLYVSFPFTNRRGEPVAYQHRKAYDWQRNHDSDAGRPKGQGIFVARAGDPLDVLSWAIVEAPIDALSLAAAGRNAIALGGTTSGPSWLGQWLNDHGAWMSTVWLAQDNDPNGSGDKGAERVASALLNSGLVLERRKPEGKDWNDDLLKLGQDGLRASLANHVRHLVPQGASLRDGFWVKTRDYDIGHKHLREEADIVWVDESARQEPYVREAQEFEPSPDAPIRDLVMEANRPDRLVAYATLRPDTHYDYPADEVAPPYYWRRVWWLRESDCYGPNTPIEGVDPTSIRAGQLSRRASQWGKLA